MTRTREITTRLLKAIIRGKLRGGIDSRTSAIRTCTDLLAALRMSAGTAWKRGNRAHDKFVAEQRKMANDIKLGPGLRAECCVRLCALAGYVGVEVLGDGAADRYTRTLVAVGTKPVAQPAMKLPPTENAQQHADLVLEFTDLVRK